MNEPSRPAADSPPTVPASAASELAACRRELDQLQREFDGFSYAVAHDLRAPMRAVAGFMAALNEDYGRQLPAPAQSYLFRAIEATTRSQRMLDALLRLSRLGRQRLETAPTSLAAVVDEVRQEAMRDGSGRDIEWRIGPLPTVTCDRVLVHEAVGHLLANAVKFTRRQPRAVIEVFARATDRPPVIVVRDNGVGFNGARAELLFMPFARFHAQQEFEGIGAGLAIVEKIVRKHGGRIWSEAEEGAGATFSFTLETAPDAQRKTPPFDGVKMVDPSGFEPLTSSMPLRRSTN